MAPGTPTVAIVPAPYGGVVAFEELGDPRGVPCLFLHGTPGSRHTARWVLGADDPLLSAARLVCVDRPGCGLSSPAGPGFEPGVQALMAVADALELNEVSLLGVSGGAAFALMMASRPDSRVTKVLLLSAAVPLDRSSRRLPSRANRLARELSLRAPGVARRVLVRSAGRPTSAGEGALPEADALVHAQLAADPGRVDARQADLRAIVDRRAVGAVAELAAYARPWSLRPEDIEVPVVAWHGRADAAAPLGPTQAFITGVPRGHLHVVEGGHLAPLLCTRAVAAELVAR